MLEKKLNEYNIFALRDLARKTGVSSPTSKKKEQLIKEILEITSGEKKPIESKTKQGRPPKMFGYDFTSVFDFAENNLSTQTLNQEVVTYSHDDILTVAGWIELVNNGAGILWVDKNFKNEQIFIQSEILKSCVVKNGDRIVAEVVVVENQKVVKNIFSINDCPILSMSKKREDYDSIEHVLPSKLMKFKKSMFQDLQILKGENVYVYGDDNNQNTQLAIELLNDAEIENKLYVNVSVAGKNQILLKNLNSTENFLANIIDESDIAKRIVCLAIERAKRILEIGQDVLMVVDDMNSICAVEKFGTMLVKSLATVAKATKTKGSITLVSIMPNKDLNLIEKLADKRLKIENKIISK